MSHFKPYKSKKRLDKSRKSIFSSDEQEYSTYGSPEHAKWLYERNLDLLGVRWDQETMDEIKNADSHAKFQALCRRLSGFKS